MIEGKRFQKRVENFLCERCNNTVKGDGYTDHCSECLWSKHVDVNPGDRKSECKGLMEPIGVERKGDSFLIHYKCLKCGFYHKVKSHKQDNVENIIGLSGKKYD